MYQDLIKDVKESMQPVVDMAEINKKATERLFALQSEYVADFINSGLAQMKALTEVKEPNQLVDLQVQYFKSLEAKTTDLAEKEIAAMTEAKEQLTDIVEKSWSDLSDKQPPFMDIQKFMETAAPEAPAATKKAPVKSTRKAAAAA